MSRAFSAAIGVAVLLSASGALAQLTFYSGEGMRGRTFVVDREIDNFDHYGFNDRAASVIVQRGRWEVCEDAYFAGRCVILSAGQYPSLAALNMQYTISSARRIRSGSNASHYPPPPVPAPYAYYPQAGEALYEANVVAVRAVTGPPEQRCWVEQQYAGGNANVPGAILGGVLGGVLGHQVGGGRGQDVATALGAVGGALVGSNVNRGSGYTQDVRRCQVVPGSGRAEYWDVTYVFRGREHRTQLSAPPGATITVNGRGEPRM
jgi:uncharacterized protein YcfJ